MSLTTQLGAPPEAIAGTHPSIAFAVKLGAALHRYGMPAHLLEDTMRALAARLGIEGNFFATPTGFFASFGTPAEQRTTMVRVDPGTVNLEKTIQLDALTRSVIAGDVSPDAATLRIDEIVARPPRYGPFVTACSFGLSSATSARFFGGGWREVAGASLIGVVVGVISVVFGRRDRTTRVFEPVAATVGAAMAVVASQVLVPSSVYVMTVAGLIVLLPGLTLTVAMRELATQNLVAGTARLTGAGLVFFEMGFGVALGWQVSKLYPAVAMAVDPLPLPFWTEGLALLVSAVSFTVLFRARPVDVGWILVAAAVAFAGARTGAWLLGPELGVCVGAIALGTSSNALSRMADRPSSTWVVPGLMLLVPGSVGFGSISKFMASDVVSGVEAAFRMLLIAVSLVTGLLLANVLVLPRRHV